MPTKETIWVTIGSYGGIHDLTNMSVENLPALRQELYFELERRARANIHFMRNEAASDMLMTHADYHLLIDRDMYFTPDDVWGLYRYLQNPAVHVVGGLYIRTLSPFSPNVSVKISKNNENDTSLIDFMQKLDINQGLIPVDGTGTGFMMIKREVYEKIPFPWFEVPYNENFTKVSDDVHFCRKVRAHGLGVYLATDITVGHIGEKIYTWKDWLGIKEHVLRVARLELFDEKKVKRPEGINISIVIPYRDMPEHINKCLKSLKSQIIKGDEIIIVDSSINIKETFSYPQELSEYIKIRRLESEDAFKFCTSNNIGFKEAKNDIVFFMGADIELSDYCIANHLKEHLHWQGNNLIVNSRIDSREPKLTIEPDFRLGHIEDFNNMDWRWFMGSCFSLNKQFALEKICENGNLFDPRFEPDWGYDDNEMAFRAVNNGAVIKFVNVSRGIHNWHKRSIRKDRRPNVEKFLLKYPAMRGKT